MAIKYFLWLMFSIKKNYVSMLFLFFTRDTFLLYQFFFGVWLFLLFSFPVFLLCFCLYIIHKLISVFSLIFPIICYHSTCSYFLVYFTKCHSREYKIFINLRNCITEEKKTIPYFFPYRRFFSFFHVFHHHSYRV